MKESFLRTCVAPSGEFIYGIHKPQYTALNLREHDHLVDLGKTVDQKTIGNIDNFPENDVCVKASAWIFEIRNAFPFMGTTFVLKSNADRSTDGCNPFSNLLIRSRKYSFEPALQAQSREVLLTLASTSTDPETLAKLAGDSCAIAGRTTHPSRNRRDCGHRSEARGKRAGRAHRRERFVVLTEHHAVVAEVDCADHVLERRAHGRAVGAVHERGSGSGVSSPSAAI